MTQSRSKAAALLAIAWGDPVVAAGVFTTTAHPGGGCGGAAAALVESAAPATQPVTNNSASRFTLPPFGCLVATPPADSGSPRAACFSLTNLPSARS
jgi:hypothetical protein